MTIDAFRARAQSFSEDVAREGYLAYSGQKSDAALQPIYQRYADLLDDDALAMCMERFRAAPPDTEEYRAARMMLEWEVESRVGRAMASIDEREIALEHSAVITLADGRQIPYSRASIDIANTSDRRERNAMDDARAVTVKERFAPLRLERLQRERELVEKLDIARGYNPTFSLLSGVSLDALAAECAVFLRETQAMWDEVLGEWLRGAGLRRGEATRADSLALFRVREFDDAFPGDQLEGAIRRNCEEMGIDATAGGRITYDLADRPGKRSRAFCSPVRIPQEVYLVLRPHGGQGDYGTFLHELGHALHFAYADASLPFEYRWLGDNSVTEAYAMLFDHRLQSADWLLRYTQLDRRRVRAFLRFAAFEELHFVRRYCAKLIYETQVYGGGISWDALPEVYASALTDATGFLYREVDAFVDLDPRYYSTRYLRAWQLQAVLNAGLMERFDTDWWRNPRAGPWIVEQLFAEGQRETADEVSQRAAAAPLGFDPLVRNVESLLAA